MHVLIDQLVNGVTSGAQYALLAAGLALIFGILGVVNFAHGEFYMLASYSIYAVESAGLGYVWSAVLGTAAMLFVGAAFYYLVVRSTLARGWQVQLVATLAASVVIINAMITGVGSLPRSVLSPWRLVILSAGDVRVSAQRLFILVVAVLVFAGLAAFLKYTRSGKAMRAIAQNREAAAVVGVSLEQIGLLTVVLAAVLAGIAAALVAPLSNVEPTMGIPILLKAFAAVIVGGFGNVTGAIISSFLIGITEALAIAYISSAYANAIVFAVMIAVLLVRPHGLLGRVARV